MHPMGRANLKSRASSAIFKLPPAWSGIEGAEMRSKLKLYCLWLLAPLSLLLLCEASSIAYFRWLAPRHPIDTSHKRHVLIVGDCNTNNLTPWLRADLGDRYVVSKSPDRQKSGNLVPLIDWMIFKKPDIIYLNVGLFDIIVTKHGLLTSKGQYRHNLETVISALRIRANARIIWGTIAPIRDESRLITCGKAFANIHDKDAVEYSRVATALMKEYGIEVLDVHEFVKSQGVERMVKDDGMHLSELGHEAVAARLCLRIRDCK